MIHKRREGIVPHNERLMTMLRWFIAGFTLCGLAAAQTMAPPKAGPATIMKIGEVKAGQKAIAWTVFEGTEPEPVPIEIIGLMKNAWGPKQDIILGKMGGKAARTNVAGGMSGSPVYIDGKLVGAVALRLSVFSPDAICGITPIELMLEINEFDKSRPAEARATASIQLPGEYQQGQPVAAQPLMIPIEAPLTLSGVQEETMRQFSPFFSQWGVKAVMGGGGGTAYEVKPAPDWKNALRPGQTVTGVLVSGDMSVTGLGTVSYNDGRRVLAFGHPFFGLGPVEMPMSRGEILMVLGSAFQPNKIGNATEIVGALKQDRHSGIMGVLGDQAPMIPVAMKIRNLSDSKTVVNQKDFRFNVFIQQKWTPFLMMLTLFNSIQQLNEFADEATYRFSGSIELEGLGKIDLKTMQSSGDNPAPAPMVLAGWWADKFNRLLANQIETPKLKSVNLTVDVIPDRQTAVLESAWTSATEVQPGDEISVKAYLRPYRGARQERTFKLKVPANLAKGEHRLLLSDADTLNRLQSAAGMVNRYLDVPQIVSLIKQERTNTRVYVSLVQSRPTLYSEDKALPNLPASVMSVMSGSRTPSRPLISSAETATEQMALDFDQVISGSASVRISVR